MKYPDFKKLLKKVSGILLVVLAAGCAPSQKATSQTDTSPIEKPKEQKEEIIEEIKEQVQELPVAPDTFEIGMILPFYLDSVYALPDTVEVNYYDQSTLAIEFYNGAKMALDSLSRSGFSARVHVFDDKNDKAQMKKIVSVLTTSRMDLLIGPVYNNNLRIAAEFAKHDSIYLVSPMSPAMNITTQNPYYIMVNPSIEVHCKRLFEEVVHKYLNENILLFTRPGSEVEEQYAAIFRALLKQYHIETGDSSLQFTEASFLPGDEGEELSDKELVKSFDAERENIVIVPSVDKAYNHSLARKLSSLVEPSEEDEDAPVFDITVMGLPAWGDQEGLPLDYAQKLKVHFTSSSFIPSYFFSPKNPFYKAYVDSFHTEPSEYVIKGYDLMMFFGNLLNNYGTNQFGGTLCNSTKNGLHTNFSFGVHALENNSSLSIDSIPPVPITDFIENKYVHLLKYQGYEVKEVE